mgnify:CR=1 FL=1
MLSPGLRPVWTMYAAVSARTRESATLRALGFSRPSIVAAFLIEALLLSVAGGLLGCALGWFTVNFLLTGDTGTANAVTFSEVVFNFRLTPPLLVQGLVFSVVMGFFGGLFPAFRAARIPITTGLRQVG